MNIAFVAFAKIAVAGGNWETVSPLDCELFDYQDVSDCLAIEISNGRSVSATLIDGAAFSWPSSSSCTNPQADLSGVAGYYPLIPSGRKDVLATAMPLGFTLYPVDTTSPCNPEVYYVEGPERSCPTAEDIIPNNKVEISKAFIAEADIENGSNNTYSFNFTGNAADYAKNFHWEAVGIFDNLYIKLKDCTVDTKPEISIRGEYLMLLKSGTDRIRLFNTVAQIALLIGAVLMI